MNKNIKLFRFSPFFIHSLDIYFTRYSIFVASKGEKRKLNWKFRNKFSKISQYFSIKFQRKFIWQRHFCILWEYYFQIVGSYCAKINNFPSCHRFSNDFYFILKFKSKIFLHILQKEIWIQWKLEKIKFIFLIKSLPH